MLSSRDGRRVQDEGRIPALGRGYIGGIAYLVWALPPMSGELPEGTDKQWDRA
jgi:hypothetical protein